MRCGLKMLLYLDGRDFDCVGDRVLPTSKALGVPDPSGALPPLSDGVKLTDLVFIDMLDGCTDLDEPSSGSSAAPGSFSDGGACDLPVGPPDLGGVPMILPYLVKPGNLGSSCAFNGASSSLFAFKGWDGSPLRRSLPLELFPAASDLKSPGCLSRAAVWPWWLRLRNEYLGAVS